MMPIMISMTKYYYNSRQQIRTSSVRFSISKILFQALLLAAVLIVSSCEENPAIIGTGLLPGKDFVTIKSTDDIGVDVYTQYIDSVRTNNRTYSYLGKLADPYFGSVSADFVSQLRLTKAWPGGGTPVIDSVRLFFTLLGAKGSLGSDIVHQIKIYEINEKLESSTSYYSNRNPNIKNELVSFNLPPITQDTLKYIKIIVPDSVGERLMSDTTRLTQDIDSLDFRSFFKGIYVSYGDNPQPIYMVLPFSAGEFYIRVYYTNTKGKGQIYDFIINSNSVRYNRYSHTFPTALQEILNSEVKDTLSYLQAFNGVFPRIVIPGLMTYRDSMPISVNRARLTFSVYLDDVYYTTTTVPPQIYLSYTSPDSSINIVSDYIVSPSFFDGKFNSSTKKYTFNIASFVQQYLDGKIEDPEIEMNYPDGEYRNVILKTNASASPVKFEFTYTKF